MAKIKPLKSCPLFKDLEDRELAIFAQIVKELTYKKGDSLSSADQGFILVKKGSLRVEVLTPSNQNKDSLPKEYQSEIIKAGDFMGEFSLITGQGMEAEKVSLKIFASENSEILQISPDQFFSLAMQEPVVCFKVVQSLGRSMQQRILKHQKLMKRLMDDFPSSFLGNEANLAC